MTTVRDLDFLTDCTKDHMIVYIMSNLWKCDSCQSEIDSQSHVMVCEAYKTLREGKNINDNKDITEYLMKVALIREKLGFLK